MKLGLTSNELFNIIGDSLYRLTCKEQTPLQNKFTELLSGPVKSQETLNKAYAVSHEFLANKKVEWALSGENVTINDMFQMQTIMHQLANYDPPNPVVDANHALIQIVRNLRV